MEKVINSYESLFIVDLSNGDDAVKATVNKFTTLISENAEIVDINEWGARRLAYPINDINDGYYVVVTFKSAPSFPIELERIYNIDEQIMRSMVIKLEFEPAKKTVAEESVDSKEAVADEPAVEVAEVPAAEEAVEE
jgi:small subunit ribosomal protein S6